MKAKSLKGDQSKLFWERNILQIVKYLDGQQEEFILFS